MSRLGSCSSTRYWFEVPFLAYKCVVISAGELLDSGTDKDIVLLMVYWYVNLLHRKTCVHEHPVVQRCTDLVNELSRQFYVGTMSCVT